MRIGFLIAGVALAVLLIGVLSYFSSQDEPVSEALPTPAAEPAPPPSTPQRPPSRPVPVPPAEPEVPPVVLPALAESDPFVREQLAQFELPAAWVERDNLLQRLAVVAENAARGEYPRRQLGFLAPADPFKTIERGEALFLDPSNYERFDPYVDLLESIAAPELAAFLNQVMPLLDEALAELGIEDARAQLLAAIDEVLEAPVRRGDIELIQPRVFFEYAEPRLEALPPLHKQMLRIGPTNTERVQAYLGRLRPLLSG